MMHSAVAPRASIAARSESHELKIATLLRVTARLGEQITPKCALKSFGFSIQPEVILAVAAY
jgi:hypothetical protein